MEANNNDYNDYNDYNDNIDNIDNIDNTKEYKLGDAYKQLIIVLTLVIIAFVLGIVVIYLYKNGAGNGQSVIKTPGVFSTSKPIPDVSNIAEMSKELSNITPTEVEWSNKKEGDTDDNGLFCISALNEKYLVYDIDSSNISKEGYSLSDFNHLWINSEDDNFYAVINISGEIVDLTGYYILVRDETRSYASRAIINCYEAKEVILKDTVVTGTIIAPYANISYDNTYVYGQVHGQSYEGTQRYYREVPFTGYTNLMSDLTYVDIKVDAIRVAAIESLKESDLLGTYSDYTTNSKLRLNDAEKITSINIDNKKIASGEETVEHLGEDLAFFKNLTALSFNNTLISSIDLSFTPNLTTLSANNSKLKEIDLSYVPNLFLLSLDNTNITELDLSNQNNLINLSIKKMQINSIDLTKNTKLINYNYSGTKLSLPDFDILTKLEYINCSDTGFEKFEKGSRSLKSIDASNNKAFREIDFELFPELSNLDISKCSFSSIDLSKAAKLGTLIASFNNFKIVDLGSAPSLYKAELYGDTVKSINIKERPSIILYCNSNVEIIGKEA